MNSPAEDTRFFANDGTESNVSNDVCVCFMDHTGIVVTFKDKSNMVSAQMIIDALFAELNSLKSIGKFNINIEKTKEKNFFSLWITSPQLEIQLKPQHKPFKILLQWDKLLIKYRSDLKQSADAIERDEPILSFQRNVFVDKREEIMLNVEDIEILRLLYEEAKFNVLDGRYPCPSVEDYETLAAYQLAIEYKDSDKPQPESYEYFNKRLDQYLPIHCRKSGGRVLSGIFNNNQLSKSIFNRYAEILKSDMSKYKLIKTYMEKCWKFPYYGSAFFTGQIEKPVKGLASLLDHYDTLVWVAINSKGIHLITKKDSILLFSKSFDDIFWQIATPSSSSTRDNADADYIPCLFIQFKDNSKETKILQIFSHQVYMMETLINSFVEENENEEQDKLEDEKIVDQRKVKENDKNSYITCKMNRLSLATVANGKIVNKKGSFKKPIKIPIA